jgi:hypothetical protein
MISAHSAAQHEHEVRRATSGWAASCLGRIVLGPGWAWQAKWPSIMTPHKNKRQEENLKARSVQKNKQKYSIHLHISIKLHD